MMPGVEVMIVNPHGRDSKGRFLKGKKYRKNPARSKKRRAAKRRHSGGTIVRDFGGTKGLGRLGKGSYKRNPHRRRSYRRNPFGDTFGSLFAPIIGGGVALGMDALVGFASQSRPDLQLKLQTGIARPAIEAAAGIGLGMLFGVVFKQPKFGAYVAAGGLSVAGYNLLRLAVIKIKPDAPLPLGEVEEYPALGYYNAAQPLEGGELGPESALSEFLPRDGGGMGMFMREGGMGEADDLSGHDEDTF